MKAFKNMPAAPRKNWSGFISLDHRCVAGGGRRTGPNPATNQNFSGSYLCYPTGWVRFDHRLERKRRDL